MLRHSILVSALFFPFFLCLGDLRAEAQAWRDCTPNSIMPGGCDSILPGGGKSIMPGGGESIGPGGGRSILPGGGQSIGPGGGLSILPGGGLAPDRDWSRGLDTRTMQPHPSTQDESGFSIPGPPAIPGPPDIFGD
jgi:hypothetical protein